MSTREHGVGDHDRDTSSGFVSSFPRFEIDGRRVGADVEPSTGSTRGHFTALQVRGGWTRGLAPHFARSEAANREMFDAALDGERARADQAGTQ